MSLIPWKPFGEMDDFFGNDDWFLPIVPKGASGPSMDVYETDKDVVAEVNLPGVDPKKIDVSVKDNILRVSGSSEEEKEEKKKDYWKKEIRKGSFDRAVRLPATVKDGSAEASYEKGVLKITMPKSEEEKGDGKIEIKVKD